MRFLEWFAWSVLTLFIVLILVASTVSLCSGAEISWGKQLPYDSWRVDEAEFYLLQVKFGEKHQWIIQAQTSRVGGVDEKSLLGHWRISKRLSSIEIFGGFGVRIGPDHYSYGSSHVLGHFGAKLWLGHFNIGAVHYSDPLHSHDKGRNFITVGWRF